MYELQHHFFYKISNDAQAIDSISSCDAIFHTYVLINILKFKLETKKKLHNEVGVYYRLYPV